MKKLVLALLVMAVSASAFAEMSSSNMTLNVPNANAYSRTGKDVSVTFNPIGLLIGSANAMVDFGVGQSMALGIGGNFLKWGSVYAAGATFRPTFYLGRPRISDSWYISPFASADNYWVSGGSSSVWIPSVGVNFGYSFVADNGFTARLGLGVQYLVVKAPSWYASRGSTLPSVEASIGYSW